MSQQPPIEIRTVMISNLPDILYIINHSITTSTSDYRYDTINMEEIERWYNTHKIHQKPVFVAAIDNIVVVLFQVTLFSLRRHTLVSQIVAGFI